MLPSKVLAFLRSFTVTFDVYRESTRDRILSEIERRNKLLGQAIRTIRSIRWFWVVASLLAVFLLVGTVFVTKSWRMTSPGFTPEVRARWIDLFRARSFKQSGQWHDAHGRFGNALECWLMAFANNSADPESIRGALLDLCKLPADQEQADLAQRLGFWLLQLQGTNSSDVELLGKTFEKMGLNQLIVSLLKNRSQKMSPSLQESYLKSLFNCGEVNAFDQLWREIQGEDVIRTNKILQLYRTAFLAEKESSIETISAIAALERAKADASTAMLAHRLQLKVSAQNLNAQTYQSSLEYLEKHSSVSLSEKMGYWELLIGAGREQELPALVHGNQLRPARIEEVLRFIRIYFTAGLNEEGGDFLKYYSRLFPRSEALWIRYTAWLAEQQKWEQLRSCALEVRSKGNPLNSSLAGYAHYLVGRSELELGRKANAELVLNALDQDQFQNKFISTLVAANLIRLGHPIFAEKLLSRSQPGMAADAGDWNALFGIASELKDANLLFYSAQNDYKDRPNDPVSIFNYAALLLSFREKPELAIQLTLQLTLLYPNDIRVRINHSLALLQNRRFTDAEQLLATVAPLTLNPTQATSFYLAGFDIALHGHDYAAARQLGKLVDPRRLIGPSKDLFQNSLKDLNTTVLAAFPQLAEDALQMGKRQ